MTRLASGPEPPDRATGPAVAVACPDARPPAYQAAIGLARSGRLQSFVTGFYYSGGGPLGRLARGFPRLERPLSRRHHPDLPGRRVRGTWAFDASLAAERRLGGRSPSCRRALARWRTDHFDRLIADHIERTRPDAALVFSDVGSDHALPACRALGIPAILSMVHGEVREEREILRAERERSPDLFPLYLGDSDLDRDELDWLHRRRLRDLEGADRVLVPSEHIARRLRERGLASDRVRVIPYAADTTRFRPGVGDADEGRCVFLFAGGISQRKGIGYLLRAWQRVRRPGWVLRLLGAAPRRLGPLGGLLDGVELVGSVPHAEVPRIMATADVFAFPTLFEGSAVVTYEALACGLPSIVTPAAGSVARDGIECLEVPPADVDALASAMARLGSDRELRGALGHAARRRAEQFDWGRYHRAIGEAVDSLIGSVQGRPE